MTLKLLLIGLHFLALSSLVVGCASKGFNRGELSEQISVVKPVYDDKAIKDTYNKKANLPKPFKLAVYFKDPKGFQSRHAEWRWTEHDKAFMDDVAKDLKAQGLVAEVFPIIGTLVEDQNLKALRLVAAQHQADALLIVTGTGQIDRYINSWGWTYLLVLPALFVPGSEADTLFMTSASLWDVKNEFLYLTAEAEAITSDNHIAAFGKRDIELLDSAKTQALGKLKEAIKKMIQGTKFQ